jgi:hypothetical protein
MAWISDADSTSCVRGYVLKAADRDAFCKTIVKDFVASSKEQATPKRRGMTFMGAPEAALATDAQVELRDRILEAFTNLVLPAYECKNCGRMFVQEARGSKTFARYEPEYTTRRPVLE